MGNTIWNSQIIDETIKDYNKGLDIDMNAFFFKDIELRNANILYSYTDEEINEMKKCYKNANYFIESYCKFLTDYGRQNIKLRSYQRNLINVMTEEVFIKDLNDYGPKNRNIILMQSRQTGKCTSMSKINIKSNNKKYSTLIDYLYFRNKPYKNLKDYYRIFLITLIKLFEK